MKETVMQFGEGGFLRGFVDYFFKKLNDAGVYEGKVVVIQPIDKGMVNMLNDQNCEYNLYLRGLQNGKEVIEHTHVDVISRGINPYEDFDAYMALAENPDLRVIVSNTTEAGIEYLGTEKLDDKPAKSYPAKLTQFLYKRFQTGLKGFILLPCELIDHNADTLKECVLKYADLWELGDEFKNWLLSENDFCNTLVDRIVTGYPRAEAADICKELGYTDNLIDTAEIFHLWVIQGHHEDELPFNKAGYNIVWTDDVAPYKKRKVRILNGGHTSMVLGAYLYGLETVGECLKDETVSNYLKHCIFEDIGHHLPPKAGPPAGHCTRVDADRHYQGSRKVARLCGRRRSDGASELFAARRKRAGAVRDDAGWVCHQPVFYRPPGNGAGQTGAGKHCSWYGLHREPYRGTGAFRPAA